MGTQETCLAWPYLAQPRNKALLQSTLQMEASWPGQVQ